jgi:hypothetical protein
MRGHILKIAFLVLLCLTARSRGESTRGFDYFVIDGVKIPFGQVIEVSGMSPEQTIFEMTHAVVRLRALRIDGRANQDEFIVYLFPSDGNGKTSYDGLMSLDEGGSYKVRGRLVFARLVGPKRALAIKCESVEATAPAPLVFADFVDRPARFEGMAAIGGRLQSERVSARVDGLPDWPKPAAGKRVAVRGVIRRDGAGWRIEGPKWHLIELADQVGEEISMEGVLWSLNGHWWFDYRNDKLDLTKRSGPTMTFDYDDHGWRARVTGRLLRQHRPDIDQISEKTDRDLVSCFVVRGAKVEYLEEQSDFNHRLGSIDDNFHTQRDGVPELLARASFRRNSMGNETKAMVYVGRNEDVINGILRQAKPETHDILARRMNDGELPEAIRLIYAGMLAWLNDARGRTFLLSRADPNGPPSLDALYCLGLFLSSASAKTEIGWAERPLIALMTSHTKLVGVKPGFGQGSDLDVADVAGQFSDIPQVLLKMNSAPARRAVVDYLVANGRNTEKSEIIRRICASLRLFDTPLPVAAGGEVDVAALNLGRSAGGVLLPVDDLLKLEAVVQDRYDRIAILSQFLRHKHRSAAERFLKDLEDGFVYMEFRDHVSPEMIAALRPHVDELTGEAKAHAQVLILLEQKDPIPALLALLDDPKWTDKNLALYELARLADPRSVVPVARVLREAAPTYFRANDGSTPTMAVEDALEAIAHAKASEAIPALIELLPVDLARFGTFIDRTGFQRVIAGHLIELTGESFGVDYGAWRIWQRNHAEAAGKP